MKRLSAAPWSWPDRTLSSHRAPGTDHHDGPRSPAPSSWRPSGVVLVEPRAESIIRRRQALQLFQTLQGRRRFEGLVVDPAAFRLLPSWNGKPGIVPRNSLIFFCTGMNSHIWSAYQRMYICGVEHGPLVRVGAKMNDRRPAGHRADAGRDVAASTAKLTFQSFQRMAFSSPPCPK